EREEVGCAGRGEGIRGGGVARLGRLRFLHRRLAGVAKVGRVTGRLPKGEWLELAGGVLLRFLVRGGGGGIVGSPGALFCLAQERSERGATKRGERWPFARGGRLGELRRGRFRFRHDSPFADGSHGGIAGGERCLALGTLALARLGPLAF